MASVQIPAWLFVLCSHTHCPLIPPALLNSGAEVWLTPTSDRWGEVMCPTWEQKLDAVRVAPSLSNVRTDGCPPAWELE